MIRPKLRTLRSGVIFMRKKRREMPALRVEPDKRLCPQFDRDSIALFPVAEPDEMGFRVLDDCCEEHIQ